MALIAQPLEKAARFLELLSARPLCEIAADHHEVRLQRIDALLDGFDQIFVVSAEMQIG